LRALLLVAAGILGLLLLFVLSSAFLLSLSGPGSGTGRQTEPSRPSSGPAK
jgi:hypothetical protein